MTTLYEQMGSLQSALKDISSNKNSTYAEVAAAPRMSHSRAKPPIHSIIISSDDVKDTSGEVINKIRMAVNAKDCGIQVEKLRKAKGQKVILGCNTKEEIDRVTGKIKASNSNLKVEQATNKDPLVILLDVLKINTDEDVIKAIKNQNKHLLGDLTSEEFRVAVKFRRRARNPLENHVVLQVSPKVWMRLTEAERVHIDLQNIVVKDQSPLVQCSRCLGYGHGRRLCTETSDLCSHCAGPHLRVDCPSWMAGEAPTCRNCQQAKYEKTDHNSFNSECPIKQKWDNIARSSVAYC